jgi:hypothetical protein
MWNFSHDKLIELIADYRADFSKNISRELYKWRAVASFHECWNIDAEEFVSMLSRAMAQAERLLESRYRYPCKMLYNFAEAYPEDVRSLFRMLYDESYSLKSRIDLFIVGMDALMARWDDSGKLKHHQSYNAVSTYLWLRFPDKYFSRFLYAGTFYWLNCKRIDGLYKNKKYVMTDRFTAESYPHFLIENNLYGCYKPCAFHSYTRAVNADEEEILFYEDAKDVCKKIGYLSEDFYRLYNKAIKEEYFK